ncbi:hypothetical protein [Pseudoclavibacter helvolus]|uniref:Uncharacterized protein n=1 Tax=Pseudoclavibacter helvolus TaxID=255205 RepID=A0A7W4YF93_9MICO|nr:hypothetical protein [Pseudoclavibacter helvolus]MBB2957303.1 hypothetical protein [Pseudoclavibacter helvolus]
MVKFASALPKDDKNGLTSISSKLVQGLQDKTVFPVIGLLVTQEVNIDEDLEKEPKARFLQVEPVSDEYKDVVLQVLGELVAERTGARTGQPPLDVPEAEPEALTLELEEGGGYEYEIRDQPAGRLSLRLFTRSGIEAGMRGNLLRAEIGEVDPGRYQYRELPQTLWTIANVLLSEWEQNEAAGDVVDAEIVDDEDETEGDA